MIDNPIEMLAAQYRGELDLSEYCNNDSIIDVYFELFLEIAKEIHDDVFLKGNVLLNKILSDTARGTKDLDFSCVNEELYYNVIVKHLSDFGDKAIETGLASSYEVRDIQPRRSGGIDVKDEAGSIVYAVDVSLADSAVFGTVEYNFSGDCILGSSLNKILADKCLSTLSRKRFRRIKDFYDMYIILNSDLRYDTKEILALMIDKVGKEEVDRLLSNYPFSQEIIREATKAWDKLKLIRASDNEPLYKPLFNDVLWKVSKLYDDLKLSR